MHGTKNLLLVGLLVWMAVSVGIPVVWFCAREVRDAHRAARLRAADGREARGLARVWRGRRVAARALSPLPARIARLDMGTDDRVGEALVESELDYPTFTESTGLKVPR
jgi:hypothetical protein